MRQDILLAALSALAVASAQTSSNNYTVNIPGLDSGLKSGWCTAELNSCTELCANNPTANDCDVNSLNYTCTCSNGSAPGLQYYIQTIPTFLCNEAYKECIAANTGSQQGQDACKKNIMDTCGTLDPSKAQTSSGGSSGSSGSASSSATAGGTSQTTQAPSASQSSSNNAPSSSSSHAAAATNMAYIGHGVAVAAAGLFAAML